jgi:hypothetical protein
MRKDLKDYIVTFQKNTDTIERTEGQILDKVRTDSPYQTYAVDHYLILDNKGMTYLVEPYKIKIKK